MILMLLMILIRAMSAHEPFPMWETDPFVFSVPLTGIPYGFAILLNTIIMLLGLTLLVLCPQQRTRSEYILSVLGGFGFVGLAFHIFIDPQSLLNGSTLGAMFVTLLATRAFVSAMPHWFSFVASLVLGCVVMLGAVGLHQVFIQHPQTVAMYEQTKDAFLQARGWNDGSFEVLSYERRLNQPEPTGWFGLSNVYASFIAAFGVAMLMITLCSIRRAWWILSALLTAGIFALLLISKSKGGIGAGVLGFALLQYALARRNNRPRRLGWSVLSGYVIAMLGVLGGAVMNQLSLLFRGQYMVGSLKIFAEYPVLGVGPGRYQDAYMRLKPSTSPEDVTSAHNLPFDLLAQLGIPGIALIAAGVVLLLGARLPDSESVQDTQSNQHIPQHLSSGIIKRIVILSVLLVGVIAIRLQSNAIDIELMGILLAGMLSWGVLALTLTKVATMRTLRIAMSGAAMVLVIHSMLDLAPIWIVSAPLFGICVGLGFFRVQSSDALRSFHWTRVVMLLPIFAAVVGSGIGAIHAIQRDARLMELGRPAQEIATIRDMMSEGLPGEEITLRINTLIAGESIPNQLSVLQAFDQFELQTRYRSALGLMALTEEHKDRKLDISALDQVMKAAVILDARNFAEAEDLWEWVSSTARTFSTRTSFTELRWSGQAFITLAEHTASGSDHSQADQWRSHALDSWLEADTYNPHDPKHAYRIMTLLRTLGQAEQSKIWASKAIDRSDRMRLDPLKQLNAASLEDARSVLMGTPD